MQKWRRSWASNPASWYLIVGTALLGATLWVPWFTAERTARVEQRADRIAQLLQEAASAFAGDIGERDADPVHARFLRLALRDGLHVADLERIEPPLPHTTLVLRNKHYLFYLAPSPQQADVICSKDSVPAREVVAWPAGAAGPGHCLFFHPDDAPRAYCRNLAKGYAGLGEGGHPEPGVAHRRPNTLLQVTSFYRSFDDERWILY